MSGEKFSGLKDIELVSAALDSKLGFSRAHAIVALVDRALAKPDLLGDACKAISVDRRVGFHKGSPLGWFGADRIFLSGKKDAIRALLNEMELWDSSEQEDLVRHWSGSRGLDALTHELVEAYGWVPRYNLRG
mgnify:CR=1 FL=1